MACLLVILTTFAAVRYGSGVAMAAGTGTYEALLPVELSTDPDLCAYVPCRDVLPGAERFSPRMGKPAYVEAYRNVD
ncbi:MAG: hypothetical protein IT493_04505, partial [Gammaproteobacteria bacterium]|nr:hypothetical protein [Gammaproteobacteria bacterium]